MKEILDDKPIEILENENSELVFHHERGSFRKYENKETRDMATGKSRVKHGIFRSLVATKSNRLIFFSMLIVLGVFVFLGFFKKDDTDTICGVRCVVSAFSFDEKIYASLQLEPSSKKGIGAPVALDVEFQCVNSDGAVADKNSTDVVYDGSKDETVRWVFSDYEIKEIRAIVKSGDEEILVSSRIIKK